MAYVRQVSLTFPYGDITRLQTGSDLWMRLVAAQKLILQESSGMLDSGVWITQLADGSIKVMSYSEWYSLEDLHSFDNDPDLKHHEAELIGAAVPDSRTYEVFETIG